MAEFGEKLVLDYLVQLGLKPMKINEGDEQTPDFEVKNTNDDLLFFVEEKTIDRDKFLDNVEPGVVFFENDSSENALESKFRKAVKQFKSVNPDHSIPNVLAFVNLSESVNVGDLVISLSGKGITEDGELISLRRLGRVKDDLNEIDLCLWFDKDHLQNVLYSSKNEQHMELFKKIFNDSLSN